MDGSITPDKNHFDGDLTKLEKKNAAGLPQMTTVALSEEVGTDRAGE
jgi:hypothetical protein